MSSRSFYSNSSTRQRCPFGQYFPKKAFSLPKRPVQSGSSDFGKLSKSLILSHKENVFSHVHCTRDWCIAAANGENLAKDVKGIAFDFYLSIIRLYSCGSHENIFGSTMRKIRKIRANQANATCSRLLPPILLTIRVRYRTFFRCSSRFEKEL